MRKTQFPRCGRGVHNKWNPARCARLLGHPGRHQRGPARFDTLVEDMVRAIVVFLTAGAAR